MNFFDGLLGCLHHWIRAASGIQIMGLGGAWAFELAQRKREGAYLRYPRVVRAMRGRAFRVKTGQLPAKAVERLRVEAARVMIEKGRQTINQDAAETGLPESERMRRAFLRAFGQPPQAVRPHTRIASA